MRYFSGAPHGYDAGRKNQEREILMKTTFVKAGLLALAMGVSATAGAATFNYNYVEGGFGELDNDGDAFFLKGAKDLNPNWGLVGGLYFGDADPNIDFTAFEFGAQYHQPLKSNLSFHAGAQILHVEVDFDHPVFGTKISDDDTGIIANAGLRFQVQPKFQLEGDVKFSSNDMLPDDGLGLQIAARFYIDPRLSIAGGVASDTELDGLFVGLRYDL
jgi:hypothetical protein